MKTFLHNGVLSVAPQNSIIITECKASMVDLSQQMARLRSLMIESQTSQSKIDHDAVETHYNNIRHILAQNLVSLKDAYKKEIQFIERLKKSERQLMDTVYCCKREKIRLAYSQKKEDLMSYYSKCKSKLEGFHSLFWEKMQVSYEVRKKKFMGFETQFFVNKDEFDRVYQIMMSGDMIKKRNKFMVV